MEITDKMNSLGLQAVELAKSTGQLRRGTNESTKAIERGNAELIVIAGDVDPPEVVMHLGPLCEEKDIPYVYVRNKDELGRASGVEVRCASLAILNSGDAKPVIDDIKKEMASETPTEEPVAEAPAEADEPKAEKEESPAEETEEKEEASEEVEQLADETAAEGEEEVAEDAAKEEKSEETVEENEAVEQSESEEESSEEEKSE